MSDCLQALLGGRGVLGLGVCVCVQGRAAVQVCHDGLVSWLTSCGALHSVLREHDYACVQDSSALQPQFIWAPGGPQHQQTTLRELPHSAPPHVHCQLQPFVHFLSDRAQLVSQ